MGHYQTIRTHTDNDILTITMNRPERRNALSPVMIDELVDILHRAGNSNCDAVILTGSGSAFCAGLDLDHLESITAKTHEQHRADSEHIAGLFRTLHDVPKPTIAAVNGAAVAGGMGLATICDFTLCVPEAKFGYTEVRIGFIPAIVSSFLIRQIGDKRSRDLLLTGRLIKAEEAYEMGLITRIVSEQDLMREAHALAHTLQRNSPEAMRATKRLLNEFVNHRLNEELEKAIAANADARATQDFKEGVLAFLEKRAPHWPSRKLPVSAGK
ncbi:MAG TPA: enoyl-CoA hydratase-related protein [Alloacidobacterium sp.]|nr:enoyl-CoA hydratase-related protein [Alloacidobacterium sp.]